MRAGLLSMLALVALGLTRVIHGYLVSNATTDATYGLIGNLLAVTTIASLLLPAGVSSAASKFVPFHRGAGDLSGARGVHRFLSWLGLAGAVVLGVGAGLIAWAHYDLAVVDGVWVGVLAAAFSLYSVDKASLYGFARVPAYVRLELACSAIAVAATVAVVVSGSTAYLAPLAIGYGLFVLGARWVLRPDARGARSGFDRREVLGYVALASTGTLASAGFLQGTQLLAWVFAQPAEVAYFTAAVTLVTPMYFLPRALGLALFPSMAEAHGAGDTAAVRAHADLSTRALFVLLAPLFAAGVLVAREVIVVFNRDYGDGTRVLQLLLAATYLAVVQVAAVNALSSGSARHVRIPVLSAVCGALVGLSVAAALGGPLGATGVGIAYLVGTAVTAGGPVVAVWRIYGMPWGGPVARSVGLVAAALATACVLDGPAWLDVLAALVAAALGVLLLHRDWSGVLPQRVLRKLRRAAPGEPGSTAA